MVQAEGFTGEVLTMMIFSNFCSLKDLALISVPYKLFLRLKNMAPGHLPSFKELIDLARHRL